MPMPNNSGSSSLMTDLCVFPSSEGVVHSCPVDFTYCLSSLQIGQLSGGGWDPRTDVCTAHIAHSQ